jgi:N-acetylglucosamine-6-sulfatase
MPPNILLLMVDDARVDDFDAISDELDLLGGANYTRCSAANPLCSPDRSCVLTGWNSIHNGVWNNDPNAGQGINALHPLESNSLAVWLKAAGYKTAFSGKYCNGYGSPGDDKAETFVPPGWDHWAATQEGTYRYFGPRNINVNGTIQSGNEVYSSTYVKDRVLGRIDAWSNDSPWFIFGSFVACHNRPPDPEQKYLGTAIFDATGLATFNEQAGPAFPPWVRNTPALTATEIDDLRVEGKRRRETIKSVGDAIVAIRSKLISQGKLDNTAIFIVSDNGFMLGEKRLAAKIKPYTPSSRVPLIYQWNNGPVAPGDYTRRVSTVDITATICDIANATPGRALDGQSLHAAMPPSGTYRAVLCEGEADLDNPGGRPRWHSVLTAGWQYTEYRDASGIVFAEMFDNTVDANGVTNDPHQTTNVVDDPAYAAYKDSLASKLTEMRTASPGTQFTWTPPA